jgi:hypothetical protein
MSRPSHYTTHGNQLRWPCGRFGYEIVGDGVVKWEVVFQCGERVSIGRGATPGEAYADSFWDSQSRYR